jgi:nickel-dependent lactate racemase
MVDVWFPYGKSEVCVRIPTRNFIGLIEPKDKTVAPDAKVEIERALSMPIGSKKLCEMAKPESHVAIVVDPSAPTALNQTMVTALLSELSSAGVKDENVTAIIGSGLHSVDRKEAAALLGEEIARRVKTVNHDPAAQDLVVVGETRRGTKVFLNRVFAEADVKVLTGLVGFDPVVGYEGGRMGVLPAVSGAETVRHCFSMFLDSNARLGVLEDNPVHKDMVEAAKLARVDFILNAVANSRGDLMKVFAGDLEQAFSEAVKAVDEVYRMVVDRRADIVVVSAGGDPYDVNLSESCRAISGVLEVVKRGGVIVLVAECSEGHGSQGFYDLMSRHSDVKSVEKELKRNFAFGGQTAYHLLEASQKTRVILVSSMPDYYSISIFKIKTARAVNKALDEALNIVGKNGKIWAVSYGNLVLPDVKVEEQALQIAS